MCAFNSTQAVFKKDRDRYAMSGPNIAQVEESRVQSNLVVANAPSTVVKLLSLSVSEAVLKV